MSRKWEPRAIIKSFSDPSKHYKISEHFKEKGKLGCNCPGYIFGKGKDEQGHCKHIRALLTVVKRDSVMGIVYYGHGAVIDIEGEQFNIMSPDEQEAAIKKSDKELKTVIDH